MLPEKVMHELVSFYDTYKKNMKSNSFFVIFSELYNVFTTFKSFVIIALHYGVTHHIVVSLVLYQGFETFGLPTWMC
jgi:hypothetical protein